MMKSLVRFSIRFCCILGVAAMAALPACKSATPQDVGNAVTHEVKSTPAAIKQGQAPKHVILMIGDGMGVEQVCAAWVCNKGKLNLMRLPVSGLSKTYSASHLVTDSAAGGTALACGHKAKNHWLGLTPDRKRLESLADSARKLGKATGLVVTKDITDATPAAFYAHVDDRKKTAEIAKALTETPFNVVIGGGAENFTEEQMQKMRAAGTLLNLAAPKHLPTAPDRGNFLPEQTAAALAALEKSANGFFLMIEGSQIDTAGHHHDLKQVVEETLDFDRTVGVVLDWMESHPDTLLVITADHQTGGLVILDGDTAAGRVKGVFAADSHNGLMVPIYAAGKGAAHFFGVMENTDIPARIRTLMEGK